MYSPKSKPQPGKPMGFLFLMKKPITMTYYTINEDHSVNKLESGTYPPTTDFTSTSKRVGDDTIDGQRVSTVFLHMDHNMGFEDTRPVLFETMIFGGEYDSEMWRYCTWEEALAGHNRIVNCLKQGINPTI